MRSWLIVASSFLLASRVFADVPPTTTDPRVVMEASSRVEAGDRVVARLRMTITDGQGRSRTRDLAIRSMRLEGGRKTLMFFESPADMRGTGFLSIDRRGGGQDEQWLYLPSIHRATRIAAARRSGSFVGSDFSYADLTAPDPDDYELRMLEVSANVGGESCWRIEAVPKTPAVRSQTGYERIEAWISKTSLLAIRSKASMGSGRAKYIQLEQVRRIDGIWTAHRVVARTVRDDHLESQTILERRDVRYGDPAVTEADFTTQRLERGL